MYKLAVILVSSVFVAMSPAVAAGAQDKWIVTQLSGEARVIHPGLQAASLKVNSQLISGDTLVTGPTGRATLVRGADYIIIAPRSELRLPTAPEPTGFTRVVEKLGTMLFKIQHTGIPHFAVDTPMLAAVVKGTTFSITVDQNRSAVQVIQGAVQVTATDGGMSRIVEGGRTVFVNHAQPNVLLDADRPTPTTGAPSSSSVQVTAASENPLAFVSQLTAGLVRVEADPSPQPAARLVVPAADPGLVSPTSAGSPVTTPPVSVASTSTPGASTPALTAPLVTVASASTPNGLVPGVSVPTVTAGPSSPAAAVPPVIVAPPAPGAILASLSTPTVTVPSATAGGVSTPTVTLPSLGVPPVTVPSLSTPTGSVPPVTLASVSTPSVAVPSVSTPTVSVPSVTVGSISTPAITAPSLSTPTVTVPPVTLGSVSSVSTGSNSGPGSINPGSVPGTTSTPTVSTPTVTVPSVTVPGVTTPIVSLPGVTTPTVTVPPVTIHCTILC